jgi:hypothetical protein
LEDLIWHVEGYHVNDLQQSEGCSNGRDKGLLKLPMLYLVCIMYSSNWFTFSTVHHGRTITSWGVNGVDAV